MDYDTKILDELRSAHTTGSKLNPCKSMIYEGFLLGCTERGIVSNNINLF
jgi:hypothetical protein